MAASEVSLLIYKSRLNLLNIIKNRGFNTEDYDGFTINEIDALLKSDHLDLLLTSNDKTKKIYIKYNIEKALRPNNIFDLIEDLYNLDNILNKNDELIIIIKDQPNDTLQKLIQQIWEKDGLFINILNIYRLQYNILEHVLVPPHIILSDEEVIELKDKYNIRNNSELPTISRFSPVSQLIGLRPNQTCKIIRPSKTGIKSEFYRLCIH